MSTFDVILHPTDFTEDSDQAFQLACNMAREQYASLIVVHVLPLDFGGQSDPDVVLDDVDDPIIQSCRERFISMRAKAADISLSFRLVSGHAVGSILKVAAEEHAELIVIASHRHSQFHLQLHGSVAEGLLRQSHCPVVVLRQPSQSFRPRPRSMYALPTA